MSVYYWKRHQTSAQFVFTAKELKLTICRAIANANVKKFSVYGAGELVKYVCELRRLTMEANFRPSIEREIYIRYDYLIRARQAFYNVVSQFEDTSELMSISDSVKDTVSDLMEKEEALLNGVIASDRKKYERYLSKLPL